MDRGACVSATVCTREVGASKERLQGKGTHAPALAPAFALTATPRPRPRPKPNHSVSSPTNSRPMPAQLTTALSGSPKASLTRSRPEVTSPSEVTSTGAKTQRGPDDASTPSWPEISAATSSPLLDGRSAITTRPPLRTMRAAVDLPRPELPPVTNATQRERDIVLNLARRDLVSGKAEESCFNSGRWRSRCRQWTGAGVCF